MKQPLTLDTLLNEIYAAKDGNEEQDEMAASFNACLLMAKHALLMAQSFAPCTGPEISVKKALESVEEANL